MCRAEFLVEKAFFDDQYALNFFPAKEQVGEELIWHKVPNKKHFENQTIELVRALPQDPKILCDFTWLLSMLFSHMVADYRSFVFLHTLM